jgi:flagellar protein FlgJ
MSIFPAVDLVTGVAEAADPQKRSAAVARLGELSGGRLRPGDTFAELIGASRPAAQSERRAVSGPRAAVPTIPSSVSAGKAPSATDAAEKFEAFVIQSCLETILPDTQNGLFGHGAAGNAWRSLLAEEIAAQIAKAGGVGLKKMLVHDLDQRAAGDGGTKPRDGSA